MSSLNNNDGNGFSFDLNVSLDPESFQNIDYSVKGPWTPAEHDKLKKLVKYFGPQNWNHIAEHFHRRSGQSCRLRWSNQLDPKIIKSAFSKAEEEKLLAAHKKYGNQWATICKELPGRSNIDIKNHFRKMARRQMKQSLALSRRNPTSQTPPMNNVASASNSACTNLNLFGRPFLNYQAYGSQMGLLGDREVQVGNFGYHTNSNSAMQGLTSNSNSQASTSQLVATMRNNVTILGESENVRDEIKVPFFDFLGINK